VADKRFCADEQGEVSPHSAAAATGVSWSVGRAQIAAKAKDHMKTTRTLMQVASFKGRIQLSGFVQSADQKSAAETIAKGIPGVENRISLKP
jgi:osmotically-inducible protein OsmY